MTEWLNLPVFIAWDMQIRGLKTPFASQIQGLYASYQLKTPWYGFYPLMAERPYMGLSKKIGFCSLIG